MRSDRPEANAQVVELDARELLGWSNLAKIGAAQPGSPVSTLGRLLSKLGEVPPGHQVASTVMSFDAPSRALGKVFSKIGVGGETPFS